MATSKIYPWRRYWVPAGQSPAMDDGYFVEPSNELWSFFSRTTSNGVSLRDLTQVPCLILLGDVGMGKSTTVQQEAQDLGAELSSQKHPVVYHDLKRLTETQIDRQVFQDPKVLGWSQGKYPLTLFLDSMDECWRRIDVLESVIVGELKRRQNLTNQPLFLRITCRSAEWRAEAATALESLFPPQHDGAKRIETLILAPLSMNNIRHAAEFEKRDPNHLLARIEEKGAQTLASHPITFDALFQIYLQGGDFPDSRVELYRRGCLKLCTDLHRAFGSQTQRTTTAEERFCIASRLAALSVFTNQYLINGDTERPFHRLDVLEASAAFGYFEEQLNGQRVVVDPQTVVDTLQTGLFAERIEGAQSWRHQSYAEFLAAWYLIDREIPSSQICVLLTDTSDNARRIVPQLEETACWCAEMDTAIHDELAATNADVFLRCDPRNWSDEQRSVLVDRYLDLVRQHEATEVDWRVKERLKKLSHPGLSAQLGKIIADRRENPLVRETAIDIAGYCQCNAVAPELVNVFTDEEDLCRVRKHAAIAVQNTADDTIRALLLKSPTPGGPADFDDDLKGYYLSILWPNVLSLPDLLAVVTPPKRRNYLGSYKIFLTQTLLEKLSDDALPVLLDWLVAKNVSFDILGPFGHLPGRAFVRGIARMNDPKTREAVLRILKIDKHHLHHLFHDLPSENLSSDVRRGFWSGMIDSDVDVQEFALYSSIHMSGLLSATDGPYYIQQYRNSSNPGARKAWLSLTFMVFALDDAPMLEALSSLAREDSGAAEELSKRTSCPLLAPEDNWIKKNYEHVQACVNDPPAPSLADHIGAALSQFENAETWAFWNVCDWLQIDGDKPGGFIFPTIKIVEGKVWPKLPEQTKSRILAGAPEYLKRQSVDMVEVWDPQHRYRPYDVFHPIITLLFDEAPGRIDDIPADIWEKWMPVLFAYSRRNNGDHKRAYDEIISRAYAKAKLQFLEALTQFAERSINNDHERSFIWNIDVVWGPEIKSVLSKLITTKALKPTAARDLFHILYAHEPDQIEDLLGNIVMGQDNEVLSHAYRPTAAAVLLTTLPEKWALPLFAEFATNPSFGKIVMARVIRDHHVEPGWLQKVPASHMLSFWEWLSDNYRENPYDEENGGVHSITVEHDIYHFRNGVFKTFTELGTREACAAMVQLVRKRPSDFWLGDVLAEMRKTTRRKMWLRPAPSSLMQQFAISERRIIRTPGELHSVLLESLVRYEAGLHAAPPSLELWNEVAESGRKTFDPKDELNLSNCLKRHIDRDLENRGIIASREVQIRPKLAGDPAQLVDIAVTAVPFAEDGRPGSPISVIIEVKCAWNRGVMDDMRVQLYERYLGNSEFHFGIFCVAYFTCEAWNRLGDRRKTEGRSRDSLAALRSALMQQAATLSSTEKLIRSVVLDCRLA